MNPTAAKQALRAEMQRRDLPSPIAIDEAAERACAFLLAEATLSAAGHVAMYAALPDEISTRPLFGELIRLGRSVCFPRMLPSCRLAFARVEDLEELRPGQHGIMEPPAHRDEILGEDDVVIVPGVAFDRSGTRLGRGGGYYDRTFPPGMSQCPRLIGVTYADRILDSLPNDSHDRPMDAIVTEREFCRVRGSG